MDAGTIWALNLAIWTPQVVKLYMSFSRIDLLLNGPDGGTDCSKEHCSPNGKDTERSRLWYGRSSQYEVRIVKRIQSVVRTRKCSNCCSEWVQVLG